MVIDIGDHITGFVQELKSSVWRDRDRAQLVCLLHIQDTTLSDRERAIYKFFYDEIHKGILR